ncbi:Uncharacterised protein [Pseudomonas fluorescens]|uniref:Uncharacterized protein n=1 Tax=Pseudomonas fluorescens TaxID=294 RepID=A0A379IF41_PSEFL|nr:Uncharacterised protein [Pseudomonas fluorescens]
MRAPLTTIGRVGVFEVAVFKFIIARVFLVVSLPGLCGPQSMKQVIAQILAQQVAQCVRMDLVDLYMEQRGESTPCSLFGLGLGFLIGFDFGPIRGFFLVVLDLR